jgi:hypothetical protein
MCLVGEAGFAGRTCDGLILPQDESPSLGDAQGTNVLAYRAAVVLSEYPRQVNGMDAGLVGYLAQTNRSTESVMNERLGAP